jgi:hypothetical protein
MHKRDRATILTRNESCDDVMLCYVMLYQSHVLLTDPNTRGAEKAMQQLIPGCKNLKGVQHRILEHAGHFIQEDAAEELVKNLIALIENNPVNDDNIKSKL